LALPPTSFTVNNPVPTISSISQTGVIVGEAAFALTVNGTNFVPGAAVNFKGIAKASTFVSATQLTAAIAVADLTTVGSVRVTVSNPAPSGDG
jgi:hypothetical protein